MQSFAASGRLVWEMGGCLGRPPASRRDKVNDHTTASQAEEASKEPPMGRLLVFVNPNSGAGRSEQVFRQRLQPALKENRVVFELVITKGPNHARSIVQKREDLDSFNSILILSGDGLVFEVLNGLLARPDRDRFLPHLPFGIVPSGSGNGLLASILVARKRLVKPPRMFLSEALSLVASPNPQALPISLMHVQTPDSNMAAFLSIGWGLMADIDIESERWRKSLGSHRFALGAFIRCLNLRTYRGRLSFLRFDPATASPQSNSFNEASISKEQNVYETTPRSKMGETPVLAVDDETNGESIRARQLDAVFATRDAVAVPPLEEALPQQWVSLEDDFVSVYAVSRSHISPGGMFMPDATLDEDVIHLTYVLKREVPSRVSLMTMLDAMERGEHIRREFFRFERVSAFRLERLSEGGHLVVDGEIVEAPRVQICASSLRMGVIAPQSQ